MLTIFTVYRGTRSEMVVPAGGQRGDRVGRVREEEPDERELGGLAALAEHGGDLRQNEGTSVFFFFSFQEGTVVVNAFHVTREMYVKVDVNFTFVNVCCICLSAGWLAS